MAGTLGEEQSWVSGHSVVPWGSLLCAGQPCTLCGPGSGSFLTPLVHLLSVQPGSGHSWGQKQAPGVQAAWHTPLSAHAGASSWVPFPAPPGQSLLGIKPAQAYSLLPEPLGLPGRQGLLPTPLLAASSVSPSETRAPGRPALSLSSPASAHEVRGPGSPTPAAQQLHSSCPHCWIPSA